MTPHCQWPRVLLLLLLTAQFLIGGYLFLVTFGRSIKGLESRTMTAALDAVAALTTEGHMQLPDTERAEWTVARRFADAAKVEGLGYANLAFQASLTMTASAILAAALLLVDRIARRRAARRSAEVSSRPR